MDKEKLALYKENMEKARILREQNQGVKKPFQSIESDISGIKENIESFINPDVKHDLKRGEKTYKNLDSVEVLDRDMFCDILNTPEMFDNINIDFSDKINAKKTSSALSNIVSRVNISLSNIQMYANTINHEKNQYRIVVNIPKKFFSE